MAMAEELKQNGCEITGIITLGRVAKSETTYVIDGQHRLEAFKLSEMKEIIVDVRICHFDTMADAAEEFVRLNTALVKMRPDDVLRGLEFERCRAANHSQELRICRLRSNSAGPKVPILSMSAVIRCWSASAYEAGSNAGVGAAAIAQSDPTAAQELIVFLLTAHAAWGRDPEYYRLWGNLNLVLCMWLWRRLVMDKERIGKRYVLLGPAQFKQCLMALSADTNYLDWLIGRNVGDRDRGPCYSRIKSLFITRLSIGTKNKPLMPAPAWASR